MLPIHTNLHDIERTIRHQFYYQTRILKLPNSLRIHNIHSFFKYQNKTLVRDRVNWDS